MLVTKSCLTLCDPMDCSLPGSSVHGDSLAGIMEWVAIPFTRGSSWYRIELRSPALQVDSLPSEPSGKPMEESGKYKICRTSRLESQGRSDVAAWVWIQNLSRIPSSLKVKVTQSCLTLCDPIDYKAHGILQARILEWVAFLFSGDLPDPWIKPRSPALQAASLPTELSGKPLFFEDLHFSS